ncbi:hypothetical protein [Rothia terrae]|uniref:hypothetical protein n=1 Tax=Rothia terrae TaxID=396015 RepID=UPI002882C11A|nr:hypothetical protein [Rothia terrae]MDT0189110.1 hypothetical protein [Rothia terrae]
MKYPPHMIQTQNRNGRKRGLEITKRDEEILRFIGRWWCISTTHYIRATHPISEWENWYIGTETTPEIERDSYNAHNSLRRRITKLARASEQYVVAARREHATSCMWLTKLGGETLDLPFREYIFGNILRAEHSFMACDIGTQLENMGLTIYSERELIRGMTVNGEPIWDENEPVFYKYQDHTGKVKVPKRPDLLAKCRDGFAFIEVERKRNQSHEYYYNKLKTYIANGDCKAIWYVVESEAVAQKIHTERQRLLQEYPRNTTPILFIRAVKQPSGYYLLKHSDKLTQMRAQIGA